MKQILFYSLLSLFAFTSCKKDTVRKSSDTKVQGVHFSYGAGFSETGAYFVNEQAGVIVIHPGNFTGSSDVFRVTVVPAEEAAVSLEPASVLDLRAPKEVTITAEDGTRRKYTLVRSKTPIHAIAFDKTAGTLDAQLGLRQVRMAKMVGTDLQFTMGTLIYGGDYNLISERLFFSLAGAVNNNGVKPGTYEGASKALVMLEWPYYNFPFSSVAAGYVVIESYDPVLQLCSGRIEGLTSNLLVTSGVVQRSVTIEGRFENIPVAQ